MPRFGRKGNKWFDIETGQEVIDPNILRKLRGGGRGALDTLQYITKGSPSQGTFQMGGGPTQSVEDILREIGPAGTTGMPQGMLGRMSSAIAGIPERIQTGEDFLSDVVDMIFPLNKNIIVSFWSCRLILNFKYLI